LEQRSPGSAEVGLRAQAPNPLGGGDNKAASLSGAQEKRTRNQARVIVT
jgi:hypothetical protein